MTRKSKSPFSSSLHLETLLAQGATRAFDSIRDELAGVPTQALQLINLDVGRAARRGLVVADRLQPLLPDLSTMSHLDYAKVERLPTYSLALLYAHERAEAPDENEVPLADLVARGTLLRADLMRTAEMLAHFGLVSSERVAFIRRGQGHADLAADLLALGVMLGGVWAIIHDKVVISREQVEQAIPLSAQLQQAIGVKESKADPLKQRTDARHVRAQVYTLFMRAYDECRRGVSHLRWHQRDAASIVPSLYPRRGGRPKPEEAADDLVSPDGVSEPEGVPPSGAVEKAEADAIAAE